jgi:O-antigen biosynthesis rhamnosyltransferase
MKVLHLSSTFYPDSYGGVENSVFHLCLGLKSLGVESRVLTTSNNPFPQEIEISGIKVFRAKETIKIASNKFSIQSINLYKELIEWADIIHYNYPWPFSDFIHFYVRANKKTIVTYHADIVKQKYLKYIYFFLQNAFLKDISKIVCTSENYFKSSSVLRKFEEKVEVIPIGIDEEAYPEPSDGQLSFVKDIVGDDFFLFVGVLRYYKGISYLIDALKNLSVKLVICGQGPFEKKLKQQANNLGLKNIYFVGMVSEEEKVSLFKLCKAVVFPSILRSEAFGISLVEGLMFGKALISTRINTGTSYVNLNGKTGIEVEPKNSLALRDAILTISSNSSLRKEMERNSRLRFEQLFGNKAMSKNYYNIYKTL